MIRHKWIHGTGSAETIRIFLHDLVMVTVLEAVKTAMHQNCLFDIIFLHDFQSPFRIKMCISVAFREELKFLAVPQAARPPPIARLSPLLQYPATICAR